MGNLGLLEGYESNLGVDLRLLFMGDVPLSYSFEQSLGNIWSAQTSGNSSPVQSESVMRPPHAHFILLSMACGRPRLSSRDFPPFSPVHLLPLTCAIAAHLHGNPFFLLSLASRPRKWNVQRSACGRHFRMNAATCSTAGASLYPRFVILVRSRHLVVSLLACVSCVFCKPLLILRPLFTPLSISFCLSLLLLFFFSPSLDVDQL